MHEIAKIRGEDFDQAAHVLWVKGKGRKLKSIPLHPMLIELASGMPAVGWWFPMRGYPSEHVHSKSVSEVVGAGDAACWGAGYAALFAALVCDDTVG